MIDSNIQRALKKSWMYLLIGGILAFPTQLFNRPLPVANLVVGGLVLLAGIYSFMRGYKDPAARRRIQQMNFLSKHIASENKRKYLAVGALYSVKPYLTLECLPSFFLQTEEEVESCKKLYRESWGITDYQSANKQLEWLLQSGHRKDRQVINQIENILAQFQDNQMVEETAQLFDSISKIECAIYPEMTQYIDKRIIPQCTSVAGFDYIRGASLAKYCFNMGYIPEEEAWEYIIRFCRMTASEFQSWEELAVSFLIGRYIWSGDPIQQESVEHLSWLFSFYPESEVDELQQNLWKKYAIQDLKD